MEVEWRLSGGMELRVREKGGGGGKYPYNYVLGQELPSSDPPIEIGRRLVRNGCS